MRLVRLWVLLTMICAAVAAAGQTGPGPSAELQKLNIRRLILTDGSFELIRKYELKAGRVRFLSADRGEWEEMPVSIVDWAATEKYARDEASRRESRAQESRAEEAKTQSELNASSPEIAPGIRLPDGGGTYLLDVFQGRPELNPVLQNGADVKKNTGSNILRGIINPVAGSKRSIELKGPHASLQAHVADPVIYVAVDREAEYTPQTAQGRFRIVRCDLKNSNRIVGAVNIAVYGKVKQQAGFVETRVEPVAGQWIRVRPAVPLTPGEYALVEMLGEKGMNTFVWDFGYNPAAPANPGAQGPRQGRSSEPPVLLKPKPTRK